MPCRALTAQEYALLDCDWVRSAPPSDKAISVKSQPPPCSVFRTAAKNSAKSASEKTIIHKGAPSACGRRTLLQARPTSQKWQHRSLTRIVPTRTSIWSLFLRLEVLDEGGRRIAPLFLGAF